MRSPLALLLPLLAPVVFLLAPAPSEVVPERRVTRDVVYGHKAGMALTYDVIGPAQPNGAGVLYLVSGGWVSMYVDPERALELPRLGARLEALVDDGFTVYLVRHGSSPWFKVPDAVRDVTDAARHIRGHAAERGVDPDRLGAMGESAGGHLALILGTKGKDPRADSRRAELRAGSRMRAVVASFPPVDLRDFVGPSEKFPALDFTAQAAPRVSPVLHASADDAPALLLHGTRDRLVPLEQSERMRAALTEAGVTNDLIVFDGAGHGFDGTDADRALEATVAWFQTHLLAD